MIRKKLTIILLITLAIFINNSCTESFLEKTPPGVVTDESLADTKGIESLLIGAYSVLDGIDWSCDWLSGSSSNWFFGDVYADDAYTGSRRDDVPFFQDIEKYKQTPETGFGWGYYTCRWKSAYEGVSRSNDVLRVVDLALDRNTISEDEAVQFRAEARFLRGLYHLKAIQLWDFIPFIDENEITGLVENLPPSTLESNAGDIRWGELGGDGYIPWDKVEEDLQFAIDHLPDKRRNGHVGRTYKHAALAIMAKVKLFQADFSSSLTLLNEIINSGDFSLVPDFNYNFRISGNNNAESIFQVQASVNEGGTFRGVNGNLGEITNFPNGGGPVGCCNRQQPSQNLVNAFKITDGSLGGVIAGLPYLKAFGLDFNEVGDDVKSDDGIDWSEPFTPDTRPLDPRLDWTVGRRGIPYLDWGPHPGSAWIFDQAFSGPYNSIKLVYRQDEEGVGSQPGSEWGGGTTANNYSIVRYADVLLMAAECEVESGDLSRARELVNEVRGRMVDNPQHWVRFDNDSLAANYQIARYPSSGVSDPFQTQDGAREAVRFERRLELAMEGHRFWDLKKWGVAKSTLNAYLEIEKTKRSYLLTAEFADKNIRHPIPQYEIDISKGVLKQNPGY
jgi:hypothetical protein